MKLPLKIILIVALAFVLFILGMDYSDFIAVIALMIYMELNFRDIKKLAQNQ